MRGIQYAAACRFNHRRLRHTGSSAYADDDSGDYSRGMFCPRFCISLSLRKSEGAGKTGRAPHPRSRRLFATRLAAYEHTGLAEASGLPCAMALRLIRDRPGDPALCDTIALGQLSPPLDLTPASGRRTQSTSPYAQAMLVFRCLCVHRISPHVVTIASAPLVAGDERSYAFDLPDGATGIFLFRGLDRLLVICPSGYFVAGFARRFHLRWERTR